MAEFPLQIRIGLEDWVVPLIEDLSPIIAEREDQDKCLQIVLDYVKQNGIRVELKTDVG